MIIFLYGPDTYRSRQNLNKIIEHYKEIHKSGLNLKYFDGQDLDFEDLKSGFQTTSMFKEKKLMILTDVSANTEFKENFLKNSEKFVNSENVILFYEGEKIPKNDSFFAFLEKQAKSQEFKLLGGQPLKNWLKKEFEKYRTKVEPGVVEKLIDFVGNDLWCLSNEVQKLAAYKKNDKIGEKDINLLVRPKIDTDIFKTIDAIAQRNKKQALALLHQHLEKGDSPLYLLSMINFQFRNILGVKDLMERGKPLSGAGLKPFVAQKSYWQAQRFTLEELKKIYRKIFQVDYKIKTGRIEPQVALDLFIAEV